MVFVKLTLPVIVPEKLRASVLITRLPALVSELLVMTEPTPAIRLSFQKP